MTYEYERAGTASVFLFSVAGYEVILPGLRRAQWSAPLRSCSRGRVRILAKREI